MDYQIYQLAGMHANPADIGLLDKEEREAYTRRGERYLLERALLKREIARRLACRPDEVKLTYTAHGKPIHPHCHFNISHSGDYLCLAFHHSSIGADIEQIRPRPLAKLAARFMSPAQLQAFIGRSSPAEEFYSCWCASEALIKHAGATIWQARDYPFIFENGRIIPQYPGAPSVHLFTPAPGYCGAIAFSSPPPAPHSGTIQTATKGNAPGNKVT